MSSGEGRCRGLYGPNTCSSDLTITNKNQRQIPRMLQNRAGVQDTGRQSVSVQHIYWAWGWDTQGISTTWETSSHRLGEAFYWCSEFGMAF